MSAYFTVYCDEPECRAKVETAEDYDFMRAVDEAVRHGWTADVDGKRHFCKKHSASTEGGEE
jgi:hypothetical protein